MKHPMEQAEELTTQWMNGNRKAVLQAITGMSSMRAACVVAHMVDKMHHMVDGNCRNRIDRFLQAMEGRLE